MVLSCNRTKTSPGKSSVRAIKTGRFGQTQINKPSNQKSVSHYWHKMSWQGWASHRALHEVRELILKIMECELNQETWQGAKDVWQTESGRPDRICVWAQPRQMRHTKWGKPFTVTRAKARAWARQAAGLTIGLGRALARSRLSLNLGSQKNIVYTGAGINTPVGLLKRFLISSWGSCCWQKASQTKRAEQNDKA